MNEFIDIDKENGELIIAHMETALSFKNWKNLLCAKYDDKRRCIHALYSCGEDSDVHRFSIKMREGRKLAAYNHYQFPPEAFIQYFNIQKTGFILTAREKRLKKVFNRVMTPELALKLVEAGVYFQQNTDKALLNNGRV